MGDEPATIGAFGCEIVSGDNFGVDGGDLGLSPGQPGADGGWVRHFDGFLFPLG